MAISGQVGEREADRLEEAVERLDGPPSSRASMRASSVTIAVSSNGPTARRRSATTWPRQPSRRADVAGERAHIGALAALGLEDGVVGVRAASTRARRWIGDRPLLELDGLALAGEIVGALAPSILMAEKAGGAA